MRNAALIAALAVPFAASAGNVYQHNAYIFGSIGYAIPDDTNYGDVRTTVKLDFDNTVTGSAGFGANVSPFVRLEAEYLYIGDKVKAVDGHPLDTEGVSFDADIHHIFANIMIDVGNYAARPYIGGGIGVAIVDATQEYNTIQVDPQYGAYRVHHKDSEDSAAFAGQVKAGLTVPVGDTLELFGGYRGVAIADQKFAEVTINGFFTNVVESGVRFHF